MLAVPGHTHRIVRCFDQEGSLEGLTPLGKRLVEERRVGAGASQVMRDDARTMLLILRGQSTLRRNLGLGRGRSVDTQLLSPATLFLVSKSRKVTHACPCMSTTLCKCSKSVRVHVVSRVHGVHQ